MKLSNIALISMMSLSIVSCGGGGGDSSASKLSTTPESVVPTVTETVVVVETEPDPNATYETTAELVVSKSFLIEQAYELAVSYQNDDSRRTYLSVCTDFIEGQDGIKVDYNSCLLRTSIDSEFAGTLTVANDKNRLVMAIWYLDDMENPRYEIWENDGDTKTLKTFKVN
jgi:hypothetical protein